ncbi:hypothetical protein P5673_025234, partial [Acropora cervicornis]
MSTSTEAVCATHKLWEKPQEMESPLLVSLATKYQILEGKMRKLEQSIKCCICTEWKKNVPFLCSHGICQYCVDE